MHYPIAGVVVLSRTVTLIALPLIWVIGAVLARTRLLRTAPR
jgi:hypothetical protein